MPAASALDGQAQPAERAAGRRHTRERQVVDLQVGTGGTRGDGVVVFRVKVDHLAAMQKVGRQGSGSRHAVLLVGGGDHLDGAVHKAVVLEDGQCHRQPDAVVGTQRGAAGFEPAVVLIGLDGVVQRVEVTAGIGHTHHVHVVENHHWCGVLVSRRGGLANHHAVLRVAVVAQPQPLGPLAQEVGHTTLVVRRPRNLIQLLEDF